MVVKYLVLKVDGTFDGVVSSCQVVKVVVLVDRVKFAGVSVDLGPEVSKLDDFALVRNGLNVIFVVVARLEESSLQFIFTSLKRSFCLAQATKNTKIYALTGSFRSCTLRPP